MLDVGGHIGYTALYFASLVGPLGRVLVAEPAPNNLRYLRLQHPGAPHHFAFRDWHRRSGPKTVPFFTETLTGQNSSFSRAYTSERNAARSYGGSDPISEIRVQMKTLDAFVADVGVKPGLREDRRRGLRVRGPDRSQFAVARQTANADDRDSRLEPRSLFPATAGAGLRSHQSRAAPSGFSKSNSDEYVLPPLRRTPGSIGESGLQPFAGVGSPAELR